MTTKSKIQKTVINENTKEKKTNKENRNPKLEKRTLKTFLKELTISTICLLSPSFQTTAPTLSPTLITSGKSTDTGWANSDSAAYLSVGIGSRIGDSNLIVFTSYNPTSSTGHAVTIYDSSTGTVAPVLSNSGSSLEISFANAGTTAGVASDSGTGGKKFAIIDVDSASSRSIKIFENQAGNQPTLLKTLPTINNIPRSLFLYEAANLLIVGADGGIFNINIDTGTSYTSVTAFNGDNYFVLVRDISSDTSRIIFTVGANSKNLFTFDSSAGASAPKATTVALGNQATAVAQSSKDNNKVLVALKYDDGNKNFHYIKNWGTDAITATYTFTPNTGKSVDYYSLWNLPGTDMFYAALSQSVYLVDVTYDKIIAVDATSKFITASDNEVMTNMIYFQASDYVIITGYKFESYAFIKKMNFKGNCDSTCLTCSIAGDPKLCLTCPTTGTLYFYQNDPLINNIYCLTEEQCQNADNFYTDKVNSKCISSADCNTATKLIIKETQDCVASCPTPYEYDLNGKECITGVQCQEKYGYYTKNDTTKVCLTKSNCDGLSFYTIEEWSDCLAACPTAADSHKYKWEATKTCYRKEQCQIPGTSYTYNTTSTCLPAADCVSGSSKYRIEQWADCVDSCSSHTTHKYLVPSTDYCITGYECQTVQKKYTYNDTFGCKATCDTPNYAVEAWNDCTAACTATGTNEYKWTYEASKLCYSAKQCQTQATLYTKNDTSSTTQGTCILLAACTGTPASYIEDYHDCVTDCATHSTYTVIDGTATTKCITEDQCKERADGWVKSLPAPATCVLASECTSTHYKVHESRTCISDCSTISQYAHVATSSCLTESECKQLTTSEQHYIDKDDNICKVAATCTASKKLVESIFTCIPSCGSTGFENYVYESTEKKCYTKEECEDAKDGSSNDLYSYIDGGSNKKCVTLAECVTATSYIIPQLRMCVTSCSGTEATVNYTYIDKSADADSNPATDDTCITQEACITRADGYLEETSKKCFTAAQCFADGKYTTSDRKCVSSCTTGFYIYKDDLASPTLQKCITKAECNNDYTDHYWIDDSSNAGALDKHCVPAARCTDSVAPIADWYLAPDLGKCVKVCETDTESKYQYQDATDKKCYSKEQCKTHNDGAATPVLDRFFWDETSPYACYTSTDCTTTKRAILETRECFSTCAASTDYIYEDKSATNQCVSKHTCNSRSPMDYIRDTPDPKECVTAAQCKTAGDYTTPDGRCSATCPTDFSETLYKYTDSGDTVKKCITAEECADITTPDQYLTVVFGTENGNCVSSAYCTGTLSGKIYVNKTQCVQDCTTLSGDGFDYLDETNNKCYSEKECKLLKDGSGDLTHVVDKTNKLCQLVSECTSTKHTILAVRECVPTCDHTASTSYPYLEATGSKNCINATLCGEKADGYTYDSPTPKLCATAAECNTATWFTVEETSACVETCPSGEYQHVQTTPTAARACVKAEECVNIVDHYKRDIGGLLDCIPSATCTGASQKLIEDSRDCVAACTGHATHEYEDGNYCLTQIECQTATDKYTFNSSTPKTCINKATCIAKPGYVIDYYSDCVATCDQGTALQPLYADSASSTCLVALDCQKTKYTWNTTTPKECIDKAACKAKPGFAIEEYNDCVSSCPAKTTSPYYLAYDDTSVMECLDLEACKAKANYYTYNTTTPNQCILNTVCTGTHSLFADQTTRDCSANCANGLFKNTPTKTCLTAKECSDLSRYAEKDTDECLDKDGCTAVSGFTLTGVYFCMKTCPDGYYKYDTDNTCITAAACKTNSRYTFNKTDTTAAECITSAACDGKPRKRIETAYFWDCACPNDKPYWEFSEGKCVSNTECAAMTDRFTHNSTNSCISAQICKDKGGKLIEGWKDCVPSCSDAAALDLNFLRVETDYCLTEAMCKADTANPYVDNANKKCLTKAECTTQNYYTVEADEVCISACSSHATKKFTDSTDKKCYTDVECQALTDRFSKNDTSECVTKSQCTSKNFKTINDWSDCRASCPVTAGSHEFLNDTSSTCLTLEQCTATWYTKNDTRNCIPVEDCNLIAYKKIEVYKDCVATCSGHPTHKFLFDDTCITAKICQEKTDGYTSNSTNKCLTQAQCLAIPHKVISNYHDCVETCPTIGYFIKDDTHCLTQQECKAFTYYTNIKTLKCTQNCPTPLYHDIENFVCLDKCPVTYLKLEAERKCYTNDQCIALSTDHWIYTETEECKATCELFKEESQRTCISQSKCPQKSIQDEKKCYTEITVSTVNLVTTTVSTSTDTPSDGSTPSTTVTETIIERPTTGKIAINIKLNLILTQENLNFIEKIVYVVVKEIGSRILQQESTIDTFQILETSNPGQYQIQFDPPVKDKFKTTVQFKNNFEIYQKGSSDKFPKLYKIDLNSLTFTVPAETKEDKFTVGEGIAMVFDGIIKTVPVLGNAIKMITRTRFIPFISIDYNRVVAYNRASSLKIKKESLRDQYNQTFTDWSSFLNRYLFNLVDSDFVQQDLERVCEEDIEAKACWSRYPSNIFINKTIVGLVFFILLFFLSFRRIHFGIFPMMWTSFQLVVFMDLAYNVSYPDFLNNLQTVGLFVSWFCIMVIVGKFFHLLLNQGVENQDFKKDINHNLFLGLFASKEKMGQFFIIRFILDILIAASISVLKNSPRTLGLVLLIIEVATLATSFLGHFGHTTLKIRQIIINVLFLLLSLFNILLSLSSADSSILDTFVHIAYWIIIGVDVIFVVVAMNVLENREDQPHISKRKKRRNGENFKNESFENLSEEESGMDKGNNKNENIQYQKLQSKRDAVPQNDFGDFDSNSGGQVRIESHLTKN